MKLIKKSDPVSAAESPSVGRNADGKGVSLDRRAFLRKAGLTAGGFALASQVTPGLVRQAGAEAPVSANGEVQTKRTVCGHCSVGCGIYAEVRDGVWVGQEPAFDHPFSLGGHCAKGAAVRDHGRGERRLKYPMKMVDGQWKRISWDQAIDEIGDKMLEIRQKSGPDSVQWLGSAKFNNEQAYLFRKMAALWGSNNVDHQARICHSTTVAGVANTWGYGAMTNSYNDILKSKSILIIGGNPAEAHPVSMQFVLRAKENGAKILVIDPRFSRTAAHADQFMRIRPGSDIAVMYGMLWHIFENGWEDKEFIRQRVWGMDQIKEEMARWTPEEVERVSGVDREAVYQAAKLMAENRPGTFVWCMGGTQHTIGNNFTRLYSIVQLALGNMGREGGGTNIFRGHDNVQGATDFGVLSDNLPGYYGLSEAAWRHWAAVWDLDFDQLAARFSQETYPERGGPDTKPMFTAGIPVSRWIDGVLEDRDQVVQPDNLRAMVFWGHAPNSQVRGPEMKKAFEKLDLLVVVDPFPTVSAVMHDRKENTYLLPATTQFETYGSLTASNRSVQWRDKVIEPLFDSRPDHVIIYKLATKLGFADDLTRNIEVNGDEPLIEDIMREYARGMWSIGYSGLSPERVKTHTYNWHTFNTTTLRAEGGPVHNEYYGLPWPCWGTPEMKHPGTANLYDTSLPVADGGLNFRENFGTERDGDDLLAEDSYPVGAEIEGGHPRFTADLLKQLGWWDELTDEEKELADGKAWNFDRSGGIIRVAIKHGCAPFGNAKARCVAWNFPDPVPIHREPLYTSRYDLVANYPTYEDRRGFFRLPTRYESVQATDFSEDYPLIHTSGRLVEYEGGGDETRSNPWLAELQQEMFAEINPVDANNAGVRDGQDIWLESPEGGRIRIKAMVTRRVAPGVVFTPYHFGGHFEGRDLRENYPEGSDPFVLGEAANTAFTYGYDSVTAMQETKCSLCAIRPA